MVRSAAPLSLIGLRILRARSSANCFARVDAQELRGMASRPKLDVHPAALPDDALISSAALATWLDCSVQSLEKQRVQGRGLPYLRMEGGRIRYRVGDVRNALASRIAYTATCQYETHAVAGPGRPKTRSPGES